MITYKMSSTKSVIFNRNICLNSFTVHKIGTMVFIAFSNIVQYFVPNYEIFCCVTYWIVTRVKCKINHLAYIMFILY